MGSRFRGQVRHMVAAAPAAQMAATSSQTPPVTPRGTVALAAQAPAPIAKAMPTGKGQSQGPIPSLADFLVARPNAGTAPVQPRKGKGKTSDPSKGATGWNWGKKGKPAWTGSTGKGSKSAGSTSPYQDYRSRWSSTDWRGSSQSSGWNSWTRGNW